MVRRFLEVTKIPTLEPASPCTPVRFRAKPSFLTPLFFTVFSRAVRRRAIALGSFSSAAFHPDHKRPAPAADNGQILRQHQQAERNHPETQNRQKSKCSTDNQASTECDSHRSSARQAEKLRSDVNLAPASMKIEKTLARHQARPC